MGQSRGFSEILEKSGKQNGLPETIDDVIYNSFDAIIQFYGPQT